MSKEIDKQRLLAEDRAMFLAKLFREKPYTEIVSAMMTGKEAAIEEACIANGLVEDEAKWLANYLVHYRPSLKWKTRASPGPEW